MFDVRNIKDINARAIRSADIVVHADAVIPALPLLPLLPYLGEGPAGCALTCWGNGRI